MERALIIGATGYLGSHVTRAFVHSDVDVVAARRWNSDMAAIADLGVDTVVCDLTDRQSLVEVLPGFNYVVMAAAPPVALEGRAYLRRSVRGIRNLLGVARQVDVERVVLTSCATTVAAPDEALATAADVYLPGSAEDERVEAQYAVEQECFREAADGLDIIILNPAICIGEGTPIPSRKLLKHTSERARVCLVDVDDVARAHIAAAREQAFGERFVLGGENTTIGELYERLEPLDGAMARLGRYSVELTDDAERLRALYLYRSGAWLESERAEQRLGFRPRSL
jgi:dihydroflavonol-4-reductase